MKITKTQLKQIIKEELDTVMSEASGPVPPQVVNSPDHDVRTLGDAIHYLHSGFSADRVPQNMRMPAEMVAQLMWETDYNPEEHQQSGKGTSKMGVYDHAKDYKIIKNALGRGPKGYNGKRIGWDILDPSESHLYDKYMQSNPGLKGPTGGQSVWPQYALIEPSNGDRVVFFMVGPDRDDKMMARGPA
jgi:hypothetical protein